MTSSSIPSWLQYVVKHCPWNQCVTLPPTLVWTQHICKSPGCRSCSHWSHKISGSPSGTKLAWNGAFGPGKVRSFAANSSPLPSSCVSVQSEPEPDRDEPVLNGPGTERARSGWTSSTTNGRSNERCQNARSHWHSPRVSCLMLTQNIQNLGHSDVSASVSHVNVNNIFQNQDQDLPGCKVLKKSRVKTGKQPKAS